MKNLNQIISLISNIRDKANRLIISELKRVGIDSLAPSHGNILQLLYHSQNNLTMQDIANAINRDKSTITALVNKLVSLEYITKMKSSDDSRITYIALTPKGKALEPIFNEISEKLLAKVYSDFTLDQKKEVIDALNKIDNNLT